MDTAWYRWERTAKKRHLRRTATILLACLLAFVMPVDAEDTSTIITSKDQFEGPAGLKLSCFDLALFDEKNAFGASVLRDGLGKRRAHFTSKERAFGVRFVDWTPEVATFLKTAADRCVQEARSVSGLFSRMGGDHIGATLRPSRFITLVDDIYAIAEQTRRYEEDMAKWEAQQRVAQQERQNRATEMAKAQLESDNARGYARVSFQDFYLDYKTMPLGTKRAVGGFYSISADFETLAASPVPNAPEVVLLTDRADRESRLKLLQCRQAICPVVILGQTVSCVVTRYSRPTTTKVCLSVDTVH